MSTESAASAEPEVVLAVRGLRVRNRLDGVDVVKGVDFSLRQGEVLGIVGESGSGKTITLRAILGILPDSFDVDGGSIELLGKDAAGFSTRQWQALRGGDVAAIFQDPGSFLNPAITVGRQLSEVLRVRRGLNRGDAKAEAHRLLALVRLENADLVYRQFPHELSGGMLQRVLLAIAISLEPRILIADEATTALDVTVQAEVLDLLDDLRETFGLSLIVVSHDLAVVAQVADHVIVMREGLVVERGRTSDVLFAPQHDYTRLLVQEHQQYGLDRYLEGAVRDGS
ncbi:MAG: ABC-type dipeptide/oligopeptide/nickel transport system, ATPase component [Microbacterium sp.]|jgi:peptide/nickel transport system ATP-binding protein|uniref:ABC transporter ATP-binding protein n=1 Tax=Microbacterium sp. TaxID=51671 RepID=UPI00263622F4|nr:ABC transporter ATP-binding protein [Microbacterium sp.]MDF2559131.1 ABC-type dipeptide/oligopeptide/nickel transport system, ATPase component [Microbacterium sp.]